MGGAAESSVLNNCTLTGNFANGGGGGAANSTLNFCAIMGNSTGGSGGAAYSSTLNNCTMSGNTASYGGGVSISTVNNCLIVSNTADYFGGGSQSSTLNNCTLVGNLAVLEGGGIWDGGMNNCIAYYNQAGTGPNFSSAWLGLILNNCCTTPMPGGGTGNILEAPAFVDLVNGNFHLRPDSPCVNAGSNSFVNGMLDLDGNSRISGPAVDIGAFEVPVP
jgi:hypothetical protein